MSNPNQAKPTTPLTITPDPELTNLIQEAIATESIFYRLPHDDRRWDTTYDLLRYQREEIGTLVVWHCQEQTTFASQGGV